MLELAYYADVFQSHYKNYQLLNLYSVEGFMSNCETSCYYLTHLPFSKQDYTLIIEDKWTIKKNRVIYLHSKLPLTWKPKPILLYFQSTPSYHYLRKGDILSLVHCYSSLPYKHLNIILSHFFAFLPSTFPEKMINSYM